MPNGLAMSHERRSRNTLYKPNPSCAAGRLQRGVRRCPLLIPTGIRRVVGEKPRRLATRLAVQVANAPNLASVISEVCGLVIRQHVSESFIRYCFTVRRCVLFLQGSQRLRSKSVAKLSVEALERVEILCKIERDGVDCFLGYWRGN